MDVEKLIDDMRKQREPIFKAGDGIVSNNGKYRAKIISVHADE